MASGPIRRSKTFFMTAFEGLRERSFSERLTWTVPTALERAGNFSNTRGLGATSIINVFHPDTTRRNPAWCGSIRTVFPGNIIPASRFDPVAVRTMAVLPPGQPASRATPARFGNDFYNNGAASIDTNNFDVRLDHNLSDTQRLFGRFFCTGVLPTGRRSLFPGIWAWRRAA
jgi:hypothetical protein